MPQLNKIDKRKGLPTILFIDDNDEFIKALTKRLEDSGFNVIVSRTGESAVSILKLYSETIDLILIDILLPRVKGIKILEEVKNVSRKDGRKIPFIIVYTNIKAPEDIEIIKKMGVDECLIKGEAPFDYLIDHIQKLLVKCD